MVRILLILISLIFVFYPTFGQKVKYKDLFVLLNAKQYDQAEPFLRKYLADNDDNPNAYLFMGIIFQEKAASNDVLKHTEILMNNLDSAVMFYNMAYNQVDEKEIKRNDEYYQAYNRRDLRTGKFGVKLSDVQFDLEKKMTALKTRKELVKELKQHFDNSEGYYRKAQFLYKDIQLKYPNIKTLYLRSNDTTIVDLKRIASIFDSCMIAFKNYQSTSGKLGNTGYEQELSLREIKSLNDDGVAPSDFMQDKLEVWDYKKWSEQVITGIEQEVIPMRENLISYDIEINKLREKLKTDSVSVKSDLTKLVDKILYQQLQKYDPDPMPLDVFGMKIAELEYLSEQINNKNFRDSADLNLQVKITQAELNEISKMDSLASKLLKRDFDEEAKDYHHFITTAYGTPAVLKSLVKSTNDFAAREKSRMQNQVSELKEALKWMVSENDSIPVVMEVKEGSPFKPMILIEEKYTAGFQFSDSVANGYFTTINRARRGGVSMRFPIDTAVFKQKKLPVLKALSSSDSGGQVFYILFYSEEKASEKFPATLAKIYKTDGLAWSNNFAFDLLPSELSFQVESGEVAIKTSNAAGESKMVFIDKNGKRKNPAK